VLIISVAVLVVSTVIVVRIRAKTTQSCRRRPQCAHHLTLARSLFH